MKLKNIPYLLGWPRPKPKRYPPATMEVLIDGKPLDFAYWTHPAENRRSPTQGEIDELRKLIRPGDICVDIGAKTGDTSVPLALAAGPEGACVAVDPNPFPFPVLELNARHVEGRGHIIPVQAAIATENGTMTFRYSDADYCNGGLFPNISTLNHGHVFPLEVSARRLDSLLEEYPGYLERLRYIKIDAEGYDFEILKAIKGLIEECRPFIRTEIFRRLPDEARIGVFEFFSELGYRTWRIETLANLRGQELDRDEMLKKKSFDLFAEPV